MRPRFGDMAPVRIDGLDCHLAQIGQRDEIGPAAGRSQAKVIPPQADCVVDRGTPDRLQRVEPIADQAAQHIVDAAMLDEIVRKDVVGAAPSG